MSKTFKIIYSVIFFLICLFPLILMPFFKNDASLEKRELNKMPSFISGGKLNTDFSNQFEAWFNDRIPLRAELLSAANIIKGEMLHAPTSNVIIGKDGWLFFTEEGEDYMDTTAMTENQIKAAAVTLSLIEEQIVTKGGSFLFVPMPNKASVYGEYMPSCYMEASDNNLTRLMDKLDEYDVNYADMKKVLTDNKDKGVYHRRDSHWNYQGALIGYNTIMDGLGREHKTYEDASLTKEKTWRGDLDKLLYPAGGFMDYQYVYDIAYDDFEFTYPAAVADKNAQLELFMSDKEQGDTLFSTNNKVINDGSSLFMVRDSFGRAVLPFFIDNYENATFKRTDCPDIVSLEDKTDFVYEIVERNLYRVIATAPFMYAPLRDNDVVTGTDDGKKIEVYKDKQGYGLRIFGSFDDDTDLGDGRVYIRIENAKEVLTFEAFPIYENKLIADKKGEEAAEKSDKSGFSAIISNEYEFGDDYTIKIIAGDSIYTE
ncbi:MAG: hypothetical protein IJ054_02050 [Lachnospiraceae bacterium]|nr:hypothetical protein [Lachnospiraceae bacterium]MBQ9608714.1 hypothetical protein [Lachnospiraceae bacterium]